ncbi:MFS transporter [Streptomyces sp. NPDC052236]|uniref:MFS transporter n=1 Tax=Streptomyces sp. NPDC052236 TaxID=3365686 RepID=UPI0037CD14D5
MGGSTLVPGEQSAPATAGRSGAGRSDAGPSGAAPGTPLSPRRVRLVFAVLVPALLFAALEQTIVATALPDAVGDLRDPDRMAWAVTAYLLTAAIALPVHGKLGDIFGRKGVFQFAIAVFVIGSALAGWSRTMDQLIAFRAVQGLGAGGVLTGVQAITADLVPPRRRGRFMGLIGAVFGLASLAGPLAGGLLTDQLSWRWCFYVSAPCGLVTLLVVTVALPRPKRAKAAKAAKAARARLDVLGTLFFAAATTCVVLLTSLGGRQFAWDSRVILGLAAGAAGTALLFVVVEYLVSRPLIPPRLFRAPGFTVTSLVGTVIGVALFGVAGYLPSCLQLLYGVDATESGLLMLPMAGGIAVASIISGPLVSRTGRYRIPSVLGCAVSAAGTWLLSRLDADTTRLDLGVRQAVLGVGIGLVLPVLILAAQNAAPPADVGAATGAHTCFRQLGGGVGAVLGTLLADRAYADADAMPRIFLPLVPVLALGLLIAFFLKEKPLVSYNAPSAPTTPSAPAAEPTEHTPHTPYTPYTKPTVPWARSARHDRAAAPSYGSGVPVCGTVQHHDGSTVPLAALTLIDVQGQQIGRGASGEDGRYALSVPGSGSYVMIAAAGGHQPQAVTVVVGERPVELDVVLGGAGRLAGVVVTADGTPVRDAAVTLTDVRGEVVATTRSGREGGYVISELVAGEYTLAASAPVFRPAALPVSVQASRETRQDIELAGGAMLRGTVRAGDGRPVEDARVTLLDAAGNVVDTLTTGPDGTFRFVDLSTGEYTVIAAGYPPVATVLQVAGGGRTERDLQLGHAD